MRPFLLTRFDGLKISTKLALAFAVLLLVALLMGLQSIYSSRLQAAEVQRMYTMELQGISSIKEANIQLMAVGRYLRQLALAPDPSSRALALRELNEARSQLQTAMQDSQQHFFRPEGRALLKDIGIQLRRYMDNVDQAMALIQQDPGYRASKAAVFLVSPDNVEVFETTDRLMADLVAHKEAAADQAARDSAAFSESMQRWTAVWLVLGATAGLAVGALVSSSVRRSTERLSESVQRLAQGDLYAPIPHQGFQNEIGSMARSLQVLQTVAQDAEGLRWVKTHVAEMGRALQAIDSMDEFARVLMTRLTPLAGAQLGVMYLPDADTQGFHCAARWGAARPRPATASPWGRACMASVRWTGRPSICAIAPPVPCACDRACWTAHRRRCASFRSGAVPGKPWV